VGERHSRQYKFPIIPGGISVGGAGSLGRVTRSLAANWCSKSMSAAGPIVYYQAPGSSILARQLGPDNSAWVNLSGNFGGYGQVPSAINLASKCTLDQYGLPPLFVNMYSGAEETGHLETFLVSSK